MTILCHINDIEDEKSKALSHGEDSLFAVKKNGQVYVYRNKCPHLGVQLNWMEDQFLDSDGSLIQCTTHGALFLIESGECVAGPCIKKHLEAVPVKIIDQQVTLID